MEKPKVIIDLEEYNKLLEIKRYADAKEIQCYIEVKDGEGSLWAKHSQDYGYSPIRIATLDLKAFGTNPIEELAKWHFRVKRDK